MSNISTVTVEAKSTEGFKVEARTRGHMAIIDQPPAGGGVDAGPTPLEYLFISLAGCIASVGLIIAKQRRIALRSIEVKVEGELDKDVLMGKSTDVRAGFTGVRVLTRIDADMTRAEKEAFLKEIDSRCPISDNILNTTPLTLEVVE